MTLGDVLSGLRVKAQAVSAPAKAVATLALQIETDLRANPPPSQARVLARAADLSHATADLASAMADFADATATALDGLTRTA
jgi:hypothetical protein